MRRLLIPAILLIARVAGAQDVGARTSPQFIRYSLGSPSNNTISEMAIPIFAYMPINPNLTLDVGTAFASATVTSTSGGQSTQSKISGLTDTQLRGSLNVGGDAMVLTFGVNVPTGRATATPAEQSAASLIGNDFLVFPISSMGSGFGGTGGLALARPMGDWNVGAGFSVRHSMPFDPYQGFRYTPGNEVRARIGVDHPYGTGSASLGLTYSKFGNDSIANAGTGSIYNTGDRLLTQGYLISAWDLFRASGTLTDGTPSGTENITDVSASYGWSVGDSRLEPGLDVRTWMQKNASMSLQTTLSMRYEHALGEQFIIAPGAGFTIGKLGAANAVATPSSGVSTSASLSGFRAQLTIRTR
jgi:hypothetical protein